MITKSTIGLLGGSGFLGSVLANQLVAAGYRVRVITRRRDHARELWLLPDTEVVEADPNNAEQLTDACRNLTAVVNLVGILNERRDNGAGFRAAHVDLARRLIKSLKTAGVGHLLQVSALNADSFAGSYYLRSKGEAEKLVTDEHGSQLQVTVVRPSVIFGPHDSFTNRFADLIRLSPGVFPLAGATTRFQPAYVGDIASALVRCIADPSVRGQRYDLGGPEIFSLAEIVDFLAGIIKRPVKIMPLGKLLASGQALVCEFIPGKPFSRDNLRSLQEDSVCNGANGLERLGITPTPMKTVVPVYLGNTKLRSRYYQFRADAGRDKVG